MSCRVKVVERSVQNILAQSTKHRPFCRSHPKRTIVKKRSPSYWSTALHILPATLSMKLSLRSSSSSPPVSSFKAEPSRMPAKRSTTHRKRWMAATPTKTITPRMATAPMMPHVSARGWYSAGTCMGGWAKEGSVLVASSERG